MTVIVTVLAMAGHRLQWFEMATQSWIELVLTLPVVLWAGWPFFERGAQSVVHRSPNMWTLIGLGTSAAFVYSVVARQLPGSGPLPNSLHDHGPAPCAKSVAPGHRVVSQATRVGGS